MIKSMHSYINCRVFPPWSWDGVQDSPIINERVLIDAKLKSSTLSTSCSSLLAASFPTRLVYFGVSAEGSGGAAGAVL